MGETIYYVQRIWIMYLFECTVIPFVLRHSLHIKEKHRLMYLICPAKLFLVNTLYDLVLNVPCQDRAWYQMLNAPVNIIGTALFIIFMKYYFEDEIEKFLLIFVAVDVLPLLIFNLAVMLMTVFTGYNYFENIYEPLSYLDAMTAVVTLFLTIPVMLLLKKYLHIYRERELKGKKFWRVILIGIVSLGMFLTIYRDSDKVFSLYPMREAIILTFLSVLAGVWYQKRKARRLYLENNNLSLQKNLMEEYYQSLQNQISMTRKFRHDIANHMQTMESIMEDPKLKDSGEMRGYVESLREEYRRLCQIDYCDNFVLDAAISHKVMRCEELGIHTAIDMQGMRLGRIEEADVLGIICHLFDHMIEGCMQMKQACDRRISIRGSSVAGQLIFVLKSSADKDFAQRHRIKSKKKEIYTAGSLNVGNILQRYEGCMECSFADGVLELNVSLQNT